MGCDRLNTCKVFQIKVCQADLVAGDVEVLDDVAAIASGDDERIAAPAAEKYVVAFAAIDLISRGAADNDVVEAISGSKDCRIALEGEIFDIVRKRIVGAGSDGIDTCARSFDDNVFGTANDLGIVTLSTR